MGFNSREFGDVGRAFQKGGLGNALSTWGGNFSKNVRQLFQGEDPYRKKLEDEINAENIRPYEVMTNEEFQQPPSDFPHGQGQPGSVAPPSQPAPLGTPPPGALDPSGHPIADADPMNQGPLFPNSGAQPQTQPQTQPQPQVMAGRPPIQNPQQPSTVAPAPAPAQGAKPGNVTGNIAAQPPIGGVVAPENQEEWEKNKNNPGAAPAAPAAPRPRYGSRGRTSDAATGRMQQNGMLPSPTGYNNGDPNRRLFQSHWQQGVKRA